MLTSLHALQSRDYRLYFLGLGTSMCGTWMQAMVQSWLVYRLSGSAAWLGVITFSTQAMSFLVSPWAGMLADQFDRRKALIAIQIAGMVQAFLLSALVFTGHVEIWQLVPLAAFLGAINAFEITFRHAFASDLVGRDHLSSAISLNSVIINSSRLVGPAIGGFLITQIGEAGCFLLNTFTYLPVIYSLSIVRPKHTRTEQALEARFLSKMKQTLAYVRTEKKILRLMRFAAFISLIGLPYSVLLPVFAKDILHGDAKVLAWLTGMAGLGAVVFSVIFGGTTASDDSLERRLHWFLILSGVSLGLLALSTHPWSSYLATFFVGGFMMACFPQINSAIQFIVTDGFRGRVIALYNMTFFGAMPLGSLFAGWMAEIIGVQAVTLGAGAICIGAGLVFQLRRS